MCKCKWLLYDRNGNIRPLDFAITTSSIVFNCFIENVFFNYSCMYIHVYGSQHCCKEIRCDAGCYDRHNIFVLIIINISY